MKEWTRRRFLEAAGLGPAAFFLPLQARKDREGKRTAPPNIILCMADDQGYGDVGYYGNKEVKTPVLDDLAAKGLRLDRFYAAAPVCSPTRGSCMTGRHPNRYADFSWGWGLRPQEVTVAEALKKAGYATGHFGKWHLGPVCLGSPVNPGNSGFDEWFSSPNFFDNDPVMSRNGRAVRTKGESSMVTMKAALDFIRKSAKRGKPFLAVVWFGSPHLPHRASPALKKMYPGLSPKKRNYYGEITGIDLAMGLLRDTLRELKIAENTLVWYTSDNGPKPPGRTGGLRGRKGQLYEGGLRVPCVLEWPGGIRKPSVSKFPSFTSDIYPTLLELAGVEPPHQPPLDGISLVPLLEGKVKKRGRPMGFWSCGRGRRIPAKKIMAEMLEAQEAGGKYESDQGFPPHPGKIEKRYTLEELGGWAAWLDWPFKLHIKALKGGKTEVELYDLGKDPAEKRNLSREEPSRVKTMKKALRSWQASVVRSLNGGDYK